MLIETLWWLSFCTAFGLCVGSFLNVVIYRVPHELTVGRPVWSFCPDCEARIRWYDNIPLVSYLWLGGRCRACNASVSIRYPLIEAAMAAVVLLLVDAFFIAEMRGGLGADAFGLTWKLADHWAILLAHVILFACLLSMSAIDIEHYWIDMTITRVAVVGGFILHALWTPRDSFGRSGHVGWPRPSDATAVTCLAALVGLGLSALVVRWLVGRDTSEEEPSGDASSCESPAGAIDEVGSMSAEGEQATVGDSPEAGFGRLESLSHSCETASGIPDSGVTEDGSRNGRTGVWLAWALTVVLLLWILFLVYVGSEDELGTLVPAWAGLGLPLLAFFLLIVAVGAVARPADQEILEAIDTERPWARKMALQELAYLSPAIVLAVVALLVFRHRPDVAKSCSSALHYPLSGDWQPLAGLATAAAGFVIAAAIGWTVRIVATLIYGREAFGDGDIHLMAAAGCVAGWPVVLLGFVITCFLAITGWILALPFKRTRAIPLVPWLALSFLITVVFYDRLLQFQPVENVIYVTKRLLFENSQDLGIGGPA